jgi:hypothetical protein
MAVPNIPGKKVGVMPIATPPPVIPKKPLGDGMQKSPSAGDIAPAAPVPEYAHASSAPMLPLPTTPAPIPVWQKHPVKRGMVQVKQNMKPLFHPEWAVLTPTTMYLFKDASVRFFGFSFQYKNECLVCSFLTSNTGKRFANRATQPCPSSQGRVAAERG